MQSEYVLTPTPKMSFFHSKLLLCNSASFTPSRMKDMCQKWTVKFIFQGAYRLSGTGIAERLEIIDVGCNLKQFDGLTRLTLTPYTKILWQIYATGILVICTVVLIVNWCSGMKFTLLSAGSDITDIQGFFLQWTMTLNDVTLWTVCSSRIILH